MRNNGSHNRPTEAHVTSLSLRRRCPLTGDQSVSPPPPPPAIIMPPCNRPFRPDRPDLRALMKFPPPPPPPSVTRKLLNCLPRETAPPQLVILFGGWIRFFFRNEAITRPRIENLMNLNENCSGAKFHRFTDITVIPPPPFPSNDDRLNTEDRVGDQNFKRDLCLKYA